MCTIKVQVPGPVCVVVPPTAFELRESEREGERGEHRTGIYLETWSCQFGRLPWENPGSLVCQCVQMEVRYQMRRPTEYRNCM